MAKRVRLPLWIPTLLITLAAGAIALRAAKTPAPSSNRFEVMVRVDFGPAGKPLREERLRLDRGSTPKDAVSLLFPIQSGEVCCNTREIAAIDGVRPDPARNHWWVCRLNGSRKVSPFRTPLKAGDLVEWIYLEEPPQPRRS